MRTLDQMIAQEVHYCVSALVSTLCAVGDCSNRDAQDLMEQAMELAAPIDDWEEAAIQAGWHSNGHAAPNDLSSLVEFEHDAHGTEFCRDWEDLCDECGIEPYQREVFEHWIVSDWLADKLVEQGEKVDKDFAGMTVWARTASGQGIASDSVIEAIYAELMA